MVAAQTQPMKLWQCYSTLLADYGPGRMIVMAETRDEAVAKLREHVRVYYRNWDQFDPEDDWDAARLAEFETDLKALQEVQDAAVFVPGSA